MIPEAPSGWAELKVKTNEINLFQMTAEWIIFFEKRVLFEWFRDCLKEQTHAETFQL